MKCASSSANDLSILSRHIFQGSRQAGRTHNYSIIRLAALEARAMKRASLAIILYLPIIFFGYGFLLGVYVYIYIYIYIYICVCVCVCVCVFSVCM